MSKSRTSWKNFSTLADIKLLAHYQRDKCLCDIRGYGLEERIVADLLTAEIDVQEFTDIFEQDGSRVDMHGSLFFIEDGIYLPFSFFKKRCKKLIEKYLKDYIDSFYQNKDRPATPNLPTVEVIVEVQIFEFPCMPVDSFLEEVGKKFF